MLSQEHDQRYIRTSAQNLDAYLNGKLRLKDLSTTIPRHFRRGYGAARYVFQEDQVNIQIDTKDLDMSRLKKAILKEIGGYFDMISEYQQGEGHVPKEVVCIHHNEKYWRGAAGERVKKLTVNMIPRLVGLWLWDRVQESPDIPEDRWSPELFRQFPYMSDEEEIIKTQRDIDLLGRKYYQRLRNAEKSIQQAEVLPFKNHS